MEPITYFDALCDSLSRCAAEGRDLWENPGHLDLRRLSAYRPMGQVFALYINSAAVAPEDRPAALARQAALFSQAREKYPSLMARCALSLVGAEGICCGAEPCRSC